MSSGVGPDRVIGHPVFAQPEPTADPTQFRVKHASDAEAYANIKTLNSEHKLQATKFPAPRGGTEPRLTLSQVLGDPNDVSKIVEGITNAGQIVFHSGGDCGPTSRANLLHDNAVVDKMLSDFDETVQAEVPQFHFLLGDIVYSFGEVKYYYDQFYEPYRDYPAPILAAAGNHDGMVAPETKTATLYGFLRNFCASNFVVRPEAGGLSRTAQIQPGVFFTFEAPFVRIITLYSNCLEDPGVISDSVIGTSQLKFLRAALARIKQQQFSGAIIFADHHPPFTGPTNSAKASSGHHGSSSDMLAQIDKECTDAGVWPHAFLSGHSHNYQRFTRTLTTGKSTRDIPYIVCGNIGHNVQALTKNAAAIRAPQLVSKNRSEQVVFDSYDDKHYGYLRVVVTKTQLRIEYHQADDGSSTKSPDDSVTVDLATGTLTQYQAPDLGAKTAAAEVRSIARRKPLPLIKHTQRKRR